MSTVSLGFAPWFITSFISFLLSSSALHFRAGQVSAKGVRCHMEHPTC